MAEVRYRAMRVWWVRAALGVVFVPVSLLMLGSGAMLLSTESVAGVLGFLLCLSLVLFIGLVSAPSADLRAQRFVGSTRRSPARTGTGRWLPSGGRGQVAEVLKAEGKFNARFRSTSMRSPSIRAST